MKFAEIYFLKNQNTNWHQVENVPTSWFGGKQETPFQQTIRMEVRKIAPFRQMVEEEVRRDASPYLAGIFRLQEQNGIVFLRARQQHGLKYNELLFSFFIHF